MTQVVGSELFEGRRIYSQAKGDPELLSKAVFSTKLRPDLGYKKYPPFRGSQRGKEASRRFGGADGFELKLGTLFVSPYSAGLAEQPGKW